MLIVKQARGGSIFVGRDLKLTIVSIDARTGHVEVGFDGPPSTQISRADYGYVAHMRAQIQREWKRIEHAFEGDPGRACALCGLRHSGGRYVPNREA